MDYIHRLLRPQQQPLTPLPGAFPENESNTEPAPAGRRKPLRGLLRIVLSVPLILLYYVLNTILFLLNTLRPFSRIYGFYDRRNKHTSNHADDLSALIESLGRDSTSSARGQEQGLNQYNFMSLYDLEDGSLASQVVDDGYTALLKSASQQGKFAMIYLHDSMLDAPVEYVNNILCTDRFTAMVKKYQVLLWFGDVMTSEGLQVANALKVRQFPFLGLLAMKNESKIELVGRIEGRLFDYSLNSLENKLARYYPKLIQLRQQRQNVELQRLMRQQQDSRFQDSLRRDQERDQRRQAEQELQRQQQLEEELKKQWLLWRKSKLAPEPSSPSTLCRVAIRTLQNGRIVRNFNPDLPIEEIYAYVELLQLGLLNDETAPPPTEPDYHYTYTFKLITPVPRVELDPEMIIKDQDAIFPSGNVVMELLD